MKKEKENSRRVYCKIDFPNLSESREQRKINRIYKRRKEEAEAGMIFGAALMFAGVVSVLIAIVKLFLR